MSGHSPGPQHCQPRSTQPRCFPEARKGGSRDSLHGDNVTTGHTPPCPRCLCALGLQHISVPDTSKPDCNDNTAMTRASEKPRQPHHCMQGWESSPQLGAEAQRIVTPGTA